MSEDIDIKVILAPTAKPLKKGRSDRMRLKALHARIPELFEELGFPLLEYPDGADNPRITDRHRYYVVGAGYQTAYGEFPSLRPELKLELIHRQPLLPIERCEFGYLYESLAGLPPTETLAIDCISIAETVAEKVLSPLRRCAYQWDGYQAKGHMDPALVRHVYDVARIATLASDSLIDAREIFPQPVQNDREEFFGQNPEFDADPAGVLKRTLATAGGNDRLLEQYKRHLMPLVYDMAPPTFEETFEVFEQVASNFLAAC